MNIEYQDIEFKESWRDECQKWICGFANDKAVRCISVCATMVKYAAHKMPRS